MWSVNSKETLIRDSSIVCEVLKKQNKVFSELKITKITIAVHLELPMGKALSCSCFSLLYYLTGYLIFTFLKHSPLNLSHPVQTLKMNHTASIKFKVQQPAKSSNTENYTWHKPSIYSKRNSVKLIFTADLRNDMTAITSFFQGVIKTLHKTYADVP